MLDPYEIPDLLAGLVDRSLVLADPTTGRFRLLETVRQYARDRLLDIGEGDSRRSRHLHFYRQLAEEAEPHLTGPDQRAWMDLLDEEHDNLRKSIDWALESRDRVPAALAICGALGRFWTVRGHFAEGRRRLAAALAAAVPGDDVRPRLKALNVAASLAHSQGDPDSAEPLLEEALALAREHGEKRPLALALNILAGIVKERGEIARGRALQEESLALLRELGDTWGVAIGLINLASYERIAGNFQRGMEMCEESHAISQESGDLRSAAIALYQMAILATAADEVEKAESLARRSLEMCREVGDTRFCAFALTHLGTLAIDRGDFGLADDLLSESLVLNREIDDRRGTALSLSLLSVAARGREELGSARSRLLESLAVHAEMQDIYSLAQALQAAAALVACDDPLGAARMWGAAERCREEGAAPLSRAETETWSHLVSSAREEAGEGPFSAAWEEGRDLSNAGAVETAVEAVTAFLP